MAVIRAFRQLDQYRSCSKVAALPYDVLDSNEARKMVKGNPYSFLHVDKAEIDLDPSISYTIVSESKYELTEYVKDGVFKKKANACIFIDSDEGVFRLVL